MNEQLSHIPEQENPLEDLLVELQDFLDNGGEPDENGTQSNLASLTPAPPLNKDTSQPPSPLQYSEHEIAIIEKKESDFNTLFKKIDKMTKKLISQLNAFSALEKLVNTQRISAISQLKEYLEPYFMIFTEYMMDKDQLNFEDRLRKLETAIADLSDFAKEIDKYQGRSPM